MFTEGNLKEHQYKDDEGNLDYMDYSQGQGDGVRVGNRNVFYQ